MKGILRSTKKKDFVMYVVYLVETSIWRVMSDPLKYKRSPGAIVQTTIIFDLEDLSMQHITNKQGKMRNSGSIFYVQCRDYGAMKFLPQNELLLPMKGVVICC